MGILKKQSNASPFRGLPVDDINNSTSVTSQTGETVQLYYYNAGVLTSDAGQAAGVVVVGQLTYDNIRNALGSMQATANDTSLSFTSTALTAEVGDSVVGCQFVEALDESKGSVRAAAIGALLTTNGQYFVDYAQGTIYAKKASTQTTLTATAYKYPASAGAGSVAVTSVIPGTAATNLGKAEDAVHASSDVGVMSLGVGNVAQVTFASDGDYIPHAVDTKGNTLTVGNIANGAADAGNPVKIGGIYNSTQSTLTTAYRSDLQMDSLGNTRTGDQYAGQAEDNTNGVFATVDKPLPVSTYSPSRFQNLGANATLNVKATTGNPISLYARNVAGGDRWLQLHNTATTPSGGAGPVYSFYIPAGGAIFVDKAWFAGVNFATGIAFACSTTEATYTAATATDHFTYIQFI